MKYLIGLMMAVVLTGCTTEKTTIQYKYEVLSPEKQVVPDAPVLQFYDVTTPLTAPANFRKFQENQLALSDYVISLRSVISGYEKSIDLINEKRIEIEKRNHQ